MLLQILLIGYYKSGWKLITTPVGYFITYLVHFNYKSCSYYISGWFLSQFRVIHLDGLTEESEEELDTDDESFSREDSNGFTENDDCIDLTLNIVMLYWEV